MVLSLLSIPFPTLDASIPVILSLLKCISQPCLQPRRICTKPDSVILDIPHHIPQRIIALGQAMKLILPSIELVIQVVDRSSSSSIFGCRVRAIFVIRALLSCADFRSSRRSSISLRCIATTPDEEWVQVTMLISGIPEITQETYLVVDLSCLLGLGQDAALRDAFRTLKLWKEHPQK